jgi:hypothetical protein
MHSSLLRRESVPAVELAKRALEMLQTSACQKKISLDSFLSLRAVPFWSGI